MCSALLHSLRYVVLVVAVLNPYLELLKIPSYLSSFAFLTNLLFKLRYNLELKVIQAGFGRTVTRKQAFHNHLYFLIASYQTMNRIVILNDELLVLVSNFLVIEIFHLIIHFFPLKEHRYPKYESHVFR